MSGRHLQADDVLPVSEIVSQPHDESPLVLNGAEPSSLRLFSRYMKNGHLLQLPAMPDV
jgi:hypothetical protein